MTAKRKVGEKSKVLFDLIDFEIAGILIREQPVGVLELAEKLGNMKHANLKKHLDKMESAPLRLIRREKVPKSRKILIYLNEKIYTKERVKQLLEMFGGGKNNKPLLKK